MIKKSPFSQHAQMDLNTKSLPKQKTIKSLVYTPDGKSRHPSPFSRCFSCKTAFLKWIFEADPVGVQIRTVSHFNGVEETFKMR